MRYKASEILSGITVPSVTRSIQSNFGQWPMAGVEPICYFGGGFGIAMSEDITEDETTKEWNEEKQEYEIFETQGYTDYHGFEVENDTEMSDQKCFEAIIIALDKSLVNLMGEAIKSADYVLALSVLQRSGYDVKEYVSRLKAYLNTKIDKIANGEQYVGAENDKVWDDLEYLKAPAIDFLTRKNDRELGKALGKERTTILHHRKK